MAHTEDVERLFSWLKAPMVHYREFAPQRELAEAAATWPVVHRTALQAGSAAANEPAPDGDTAARERIARDSRALPAMAPAVQHVPPSEAAPYPPAGAAGELSPQSTDRPTAGGDWPAALHVDAEQPEPPAAATAGRQQDVGPMIAGFDEAPQPMYAAPASRAEPDNGDQNDRRYYPARDRGQLFGGEYRGPEREARSGERAPERQDRSLEAVFSRLSGGRDRLPDPRGRARTNPGLGPVFNRLR